MITAEFALAMIKGSVDYVYFRCDDMGENHILSATNTAV